MKLRSDTPPDGRFAGVVRALLKVGVCVLGLASGQIKSVADLPSLFLTNSSAPSPAVGLAWNPSPDPNVVGYFLCWGLASDQCTNQLNTGSVTNATVGGFTTNTVYYFNVVAYDAFGQQAAPSNEVQYSITNPPSATGLQVGIQPILGGANPTGICLSFQGSAGVSYSVQATQDFVSWATVWTTNCVSDVALVFQATDVANYRSRFYRVVRTN